MSLPVALHVVRPAVWPLAAVRGDVVHLARAHTCGPRAVQVEPPLELLQLPPERFDVPCVCRWGGGGGVCMPCPAPGGGGKG